MRQIRKVSGILAAVGGLSLLMILQTIMQLSEPSAEAQAVTSLPPVIALEPERLTTVQVPDSLISQTLAIHNLGDEQLSWHVYEGSIPLWEQTDNMSAGNAAPSQYFPDFNEAGYAADDFVVPAGQTWQVGQILIPGLYDDGDEQAPNFDVNIYTDAAGMPGTLVVSATVFPTTDISGEVTLDLAPPLSVPAGIHWLSVNANALFGASQTLWSWRTQTVQTGAPYHWRETSGIFATPCIGDWQPGAAVCGTGGGIDPDLAFRLDFYPETDCDSLTDLPWVVVSPLSGNVAANGAAAITIYFDSAGYGPGVYAGNLCFASNDPAQALAAVPVTMTVTVERGVTLTTAPPGTGLPGTGVNYTLWLTNTGLLPDVYTLVASSQWATTLSTNNLPLNGLTALPFTVTVMIPATAVAGEMNTAVITATSQTDTNIRDSVTVTTTAVITQPPITYLPVVARSE